MLETIQYWDTFYFNIINQGIDNIVLDFICTTIREKTFWIPLYIIVIFYSIKKLGLKNGFILIAGMILCIALSDGIANLFKHAFQRLRPCHVIENVRSIVDCGSGKSFISAHASNHFALANFWIIAFSNLKFIKPVALLWAFAIAFSQVYVGVHYPIDVICGALIGSFIGIWLGYSTQVILSFIKIKKP